MPRVPLFILVRVVEWENGKKVNIGLVLVFFRAKSTTVLVRRGEWVSGRVGE